MERKKFANYCCITVIFDVKEGNGFFRVNGEVLKGR